MIAQESNDHLSIADLPAIVARVVQERRLPFVPAEAAGLTITSVRVKPGRGLTAAIAAVEGRRHVTQPFLSVHVYSECLNGSRLHFSRQELDCAELDKPSPGIASAPALSLVVQVFPADSGLPALGSCLSPHPGSALFSGLEAAARGITRDRGWSLARARAHVMRYKIGNRCVIAYHLESRDGLQLTIVGKIYADCAQAVKVHETMEALYRQLASGRQLMPRPAGLFGALGLTLSEAVGTPATAKPWRPRHQRSGPPRQRDWAMARQAGAALARLHAARAKPEDLPVRDGALEAAVVRERVKRLIDWRPEMETHLKDIGRELGHRLESSRPVEPVLAHGGFKRSQLLDDDGHLFVVDFDSVCLADPALDIGCFLAYLRPFRLFSGRTGSREWFEASGREFVTGYMDAAGVEGPSASAIGNTLGRARHYEASHLLKIAMRRLHRVNSPRQTELRTICGEIADCLDQPARWA